MKDVNLLATDFDEIKSSLIERFKLDKDEIFKDYNFEGSALSQLIDIISYATTYNNYYNSVAINELYLPYAQRDKNVHAISRSLGYLPKRPTSAQAFIRPTLPKMFKVDLTKDIKIPMYTNLKSEKGLNYILMEEIVFRYNSATGDWCTIRKDVFETDNSPNYYLIKQGQYKYMQYVPTQQPLQRLLIEHTNIDDAYNSIIVQDTVNYEYWSPFYDMSDLSLDKSHTDLFEKNETVAELQQEIIVNSSWDNYVLNLNSANVYFPSGDEGGTYISFGNDVLGKIPTNPMNIFYILTEGEIGNGDNIFNMMGTVDYYRTDGSTGTISLKNVETIIRTGTSSVGGSKGEGTDSIRKLAPSFHNTQNREVVESDYEVFLLQQKSVPLQNVKCIGGEKLKPIIMSAVGVCANKFSNNGVRDSLLNESEKEILKLIIKNKNVVTINPVFINPEFVNINIHSKIYYNPVKTEDHKAYLAAKTAIEVYFNTLIGFGKYYKSSNLISIIDDLDEIDHNLTTSNLEYMKFIKKEDIYRYLFVNLGDNNEIIPGSLTKIHKKDHFLKVFNNNSRYPWTEYDKINNPTGVFIPPSGISDWDMDNYKTDENFSNVPKIFLYDIIEEYSDDSTTGKLFLVEKFPKKLKAHRLNGNSFPFRFEYFDIVETGRRKLIGEIHYNRGLINLLFQEIQFREYEDNRKHLNLALETIIVDDKIIPVDNVNNSIISFNDMFFKEYEFDELNNLPYRTKLINEDGFVLEFGFNTKDNDFESDGNIIINLGDWTYDRIKEIQKR